MRWPDAAPHPARDWQAAALPAIAEAVRRGDRPVVHATMGAGKSHLLAAVAALSAGRLAEGEAVLVTTPTQALVEQLAGTLESWGLPVGRYYQHAREAHAPIVVACHASLLGLADEWEGRPCRLWLGDECHKTQTDAVIDAIARIAPQRAVGFTGTPFRSEPRETLTLWDSLAYSYGFGDALRDGVLVPWDVVQHGTEGHPLVNGMPGEWRGPVPPLKEEVNALTLRMMEDFAPPGPGVVSAVSIEDAEQFAERLVAEGWAAAAIHSQQSPEVRASLLHRLRLGALRCLVHVNLLSEGVDMPWLRWLALRRPVKARVLFLQSVGRVLRSEKPEDCPEGLAPKTRAVVLDPCGLFSRFSLTYAAALGGEFDQADEDEEVDEEPPWPLLDLPPPDEELREGVAVDAVGAWALRLVHALELAGVYQRDGRWPMDAPWRQRRCSTKQAETLARMRWAKRHLPAELRPGLARVCDSPERLRAGIASDLVSALRSVADAAAPYRRAHRHWPWPCTLEVPALPDRVVQRVVE